MATDKYEYNVKFETEEGWYAPEHWPSVQKYNVIFETFPYKDDDVIVCTYPRSGTHMTWLLVRYLLQGNVDPIQDAMEDSHLPPIGKITNQTGRRVFNTHCLPANFGDDFFMNGKHKCIHVSRNPKDVMVSESHAMQMFRKIITIYPTTWEECVQFYLVTDMPRFSWFYHMRAWEEFVDKNPGAPVLDLKFEEIVREPKTAIRKMADFLDVPLSDQFLQDIVVASKFENMKDAPISNVANDLLVSDTGKISLYRKGKIGDWVNTFTVAQNELFDTKYKERMKGSKVTNIYH